MDHVIRELCYKGTILQGFFNGVDGHFSIIPLLNSTVKIIGNPNMTVISKYVL